MYVLMEEASQIELVNDPMLTNPCRQRTPAIVPYTNDTNTHTHTPDLRSLLKE